MIQYNTSWREKTYFGEGETIYKRGLESEWTFLKKLKFDPFCSGPLDNDGIKWYTLPLSVDSWRKFLPLKEIRYWETEKECRKGWIPIFFVPLWLPVNILFLSKYHNFCDFSTSQNFCITLDEKTWRKIEQKFSIGKLKTQIFLFPKTTPSSSWSSFCCLSLSLSSYHFVYYWVNKVGEGGGEEWWKMWDNCCFIVSSW